MYKDKRILGLIPARGGSKGVPKKNVRIICGKPLIAWTIEAARKSEYLDSIVVSTDSREIAAISERYGAEVPFMRPGRFAADSSSIMDAVMHALKSLERGGRSFDMLMLLQPSSPLRTAGDIDNAVRLYFSKKAKGVVSVCEVDHPPAWSNRLPRNGSLDRFMKKEHKNKNRQEFDTYYRLNGAIYLADIRNLKKNLKFIDNGAFAYIMPKGRSVDIDDELDLEFAETLLNKRKK